METSLPVSSALLCASQRAEALRLCTQRLKIQERRGGQGVKGVMGVRGAGGSVREEREGLWDAGWDVVAEEGDWRASTDKRPK